MVQPFQNTVHKYEIHQQDYIYETCETVYAGDHSCDHDGGNYHSGDDIGSRQEVFWLVREKRRRMANEMHI